MAIINEDGVNNTRMIMAITNTMTKAIPMSSTLLPPPPPGVGECRDLSEESRATLEVVVVGEGLRVRVRGRRIVIDDRQA